MEEAMTAAERDQLIRALKMRFEANMHRHPGVSWRAVLARLERNPTVLKALRAMESSGGEPDVTGEEASGLITFCDCSAESPGGRRSLCYDDEALASRREPRPEGSAVHLASDIGIALLTEEQYRDLQLDRDTSRSPGARRRSFCDRRYGRVFVYHNGAQSYYAARGFRGMVRV
jgi:hypothetical protein